jgi:succinylornithine aminotransferase
MFDEVQTGIGRTGKLFAYQNYAVEPDIISLAKALGGGFPIGAMLVKQRYQDGLELGSHGTTFGGNPLACAVANKVLEIINTQQLLEQVIERSNQIKAYLTELNYRYGLYQDIRGCGLLIGAQLANLYTGQAKTIMQLGFDYGVASLIATPEVNRFTPALNISTNELELGLSRFTQAVEHFMANQA